MAFLLLVHDYLFYFIACFDLVYHFNSFHHFTKASVISIEVLRVFPVVTDEKLRTPGVSSRMCHRKNSSVMVLVVACEFTIYFVAWTSGAITLRAAPLNNKVGNHSMEGQSVIKALFGKFDKVGHCVGGIIFIKLHFHDTFFSMYFSCFHKCFLNIYGLSPVLGSLCGELCLVNSCRFIQHLLRGKIFILFEILNKFSRHFLCSTIIILLIFPGQLWIEQLTGYFRTGGRYLETENFMFYILYIIQISL